MTERNMVTEDITEYSNNLTEPIYQKEDYLLYGVSAVTFIVVFVTAGIVQIRKSDKRNFKKIRRKQCLRLVLSLMENIKY